MVFLIFYVLSDSLSSFFVIVSFIVQTACQSQPVVIIPQNSYSGIYGNQVVIECIIQSANPAATVVYWQKNVNSVTTRINTGDPGYQGSTPTTPSLTINFATTNDNGVYTCYATNAVGTGSSNHTTLTISGGLLSVTVSPSNANVILGNSQTIQCIVNGQPAASQIEWIKDQFSTINIANSNGKYTGGTVSNPALTITNFQSNDAGQYVCRATNAAGVAPSSPSTLTLIQPLSVSVSPPSGNANYGTSSYTIQCIVSGTNPSFVSWTKTPITGGTTTTISTGSGKYNINNSPTNPFLTILNIVEEDEADYACSAQNLAGTVTSSNARLIVDGAVLSVSVSPTSANVIQNNNQVIQCIVSGSPSATAINWYRRTNNIESAIQIGSSNGKYSGGSVSTPAITINSFQSSDAGVYLCRATNAYGAASSPDAVLTFIQPLSITVSPPSGNANYGTSLYTIQCAVSGTNPTFVSWTKTPIGGGSQTTISTGSGKYNINNIPTNPFLTIFNIVEEDEADYACTAQNLAGTVTSSNARLIVNGVPAGRPVIVTNPSAGKIGTSATVRCSSQGGDPTPTVKISRNSVLVDETATTANGQTVNDYTFTVQESDHYAVFECSVFNGVLQNQLTSTEYFFVVTTPFAPTLTGPTVVTTGTGPQNWTCVSRNGYPMQSMTMRNDNTQFTSGFTTSSNIDTTSKKYLVTGTLLWTPTLGDNGHTIYCDVTHTTLTSPQRVSLPLTVIGTPPTVTIAQPSFSQLTGQQITLGCTYQSPNSPAQSVSWRFTNAQGVVTDPVVISSPKYSGSTLTNPSLTITSLAAADKGTYICRATNLIGTGVSGPTTLDVTGVSETNTTITSWTKPPTISETATTIVTDCGAKIDTTEGKELFIAGIITLSVGVVAVIVGVVVLYRGCLYRKHNRAENYIDLKTSNHSITEPYSTLNQPEYIEIHDGR